MRRIALILAACAATSLLSAGTRLASAGPSAAAGCHPYFDDKGTLAWYCDLGAAQEAGRASGKLLFIEYGRRACCNCRTLVSRVLPAPAVRTRFAAACIGLAADCDEPDPRVEAIFRRAMPDASLLPFVAVVSSDLEYVTGWQGAMDVPGCSAELSKAEAFRDRTAKRACVASKPAPVAAPAPAPQPAPPPTPRPLTPPASEASRAEVAIPRPVDANASAPSATTSRPGAPGIAGGQAAALAAARELLRQAESASAAGRHADVLKLEREAAGLTVHVEPARWAVVLTAADVWAERLLAEAAAAALEGRTADAETRIATVRRDAAGRGASIDAERGSRALTMRRLIDSSAAATRERATKDAQTSFRGTRWAALFAA